QRSGHRRRSERSSRALLVRSAREVNRHSPRSESEFTCQAYRGDTARCIVPGGERTRMTSTRPSPLALVILAGGTIAMLATGSRAGSRIQRGPLLHLADGAVLGHTNGTTREFLGIPSAAPPIGALRWRPPAPAIPWQNVLEASAFAPACAQPPSL